MNNINAVTNNVMMVVVVEIVAGLFLFFLFIITCLAIVSIKNSIQQFVNLYYMANRDKIDGQQGQ